MANNYRVKRVVEYEFYVNTDTGVEDALERAIQLSTEKPLSGVTLSVSIEKLKADDF